jgi:hypothetical protein
MACPNPGGRPKEKPFRDALRMEIAQATADDSLRSLRRIARKLLDEASEGDLQAIKEVADRMDGKVPQGIVGDDEADPVNVLHRIERVIVRPSDQNG